MIFSPAFTGKRYAVLGLARSGQTAVAALVAGGAQVTAWDAKEEPRNFQDRKGSGSRAPGGPKEPRLIVEALVVRKLSVDEEALLNVER